MKDFNGLINFTKELLDEFNNLDFYLTVEEETLYKGDVIERKVKKYDYEWLKNDLEKCIELDMAHHSIEDPKNINLWINFTLGLMKNKYDMTIVKK